MELVDRYDNKRRPLNKTSDRLTKIPGEFRIASHLWIINSKNEFLIQKRSPEKRKYPNYWSIHGGATDAGETSFEAACRECYEEIGIKLDISEIEFMFSYKRKFCFTDVYLARKDVNIKDIKLQKKEVTDAKWVSMPILEDMILNGEVAPNISKYYHFFKTILNNEI